MILPGYRKRRRKQELPSPRLLLQQSRQPLLTPPILLTLNIPLTVLIPAPHTPRPINARGSRSERKTETETGIGIMTKRRNGTGTRTRTRTETDTVREMGSGSG